VEEPRITLLVRCPDRTGLVAALSDFVFRHGGNILDADQHSEAASGMFFMRMDWSLDGFRIPLERIRDELSELAARYDFEFALSDRSRRKRVAIFASRTPHCVYDLLLRHRLGELDGEMVSLYSNHPDLAPVAEHFDLRFHHLPMEAGKEEVEARQLSSLADEGVDCVVLARYMQVLTPTFVAAWRDRLINIHHSFLPAFAGARPYHQAKERGVKVIGATAHYVTQDLDEGPIIEQDVTRVSHRDEVEDLVRKGRDLERQVLARAVRSHLEDRILIHEGRTIVFR